MLEFELKTRTGTLMPFVKLKKVIMKRSYFTVLDQREFNLLCDFMNGRTIDFTDVFWRANFMSGLKDYSNEELCHFKKWKVDKDELFEKWNTRNICKHQYPFYN